MYFNLYDLYKKIVSFEKIFIYGTGTYSEIIVPKLYDIGLKDKIAGYVLSHKPIKELNKDHKPIYSIKDLRTDSYKSIFIVATSSQYNEEIGNMLLQYGYENYLFLSFYERNDLGAYFRFKGVSFEQYCRMLTEWYVYEHSYECVNHIIEVFEEKNEEIKARFKVKKSQKNENMIVFVVGYLHPRIHKIIGALAEKGFEITVIDIKKSRNFPYSKYDNDRRIEIISCNSIEHALLEAVKYNPLLYYVRPFEQDTSIANIMISQRCYYGKIVLDIHDILSGSYNLGKDRQWMYEFEREALENADGIVWRYDAEAYLHDKYGFLYKGKSIQFWDYCYDTYIQNESEQDGILRLCGIDAGADILMPPNDSELCENGIIRYANIYEILDKIGNREDCIFSIYVAGVSSEQADALKKLKKEYANFEYYIGYSPSELIYAISKYDYGCDFYVQGRYPTDQECMDNNFLRLSGTYEVSTTNRLFDCINSGIPVVAIVPKKQIVYLKSFGVVVDMSLQNLDVEYLKKNRNYYRENAVKAQKSLSIGTQIQRLIDFFNGL